MDIEQLSHLLFKGYFSEVLYFGLNKVLKKPDAQVHMLTGRGGNIGVLITDHNVRETLEIVDRAYILHDGKVLMSGTPKQVVANKEVRRVYLGDDFRA